MYEGTKTVWKVNAAGIFCGQWDWTTDVCTFLSLMYASRCPNNYSLRDLSPTCTVMTFMVQENVGKVRYLFLVTKGPIVTLINQL